jgi:hypothetical protein
MSRPRQRKRTRTQRQSPQREEGAGVAKDRVCVQRLVLEQCLAVNDHRGPRKHGKYQRSKDSNICLGQNVSQIKSSLRQIDARGSGSGVWEQVGTRQNLDREVARSRRDDHTTEVHELASSAVFVGDCGHGCMVQDCTVQRASRRWCRLCKLASL